MSNKVLFAVEDLLNGGTQRQMALLIKYLPPEWERQVWSLGEGPFVAELRKAGITVHLSLRRWRLDVLQALTLWRLIWTWRPDIVHSYGMGTLAALLPCKWLGIPLVDGTLRQGSAPSKHGLFAWWILQCSDRYIANSEAGLQAYRIRHGRGRVIYNGFDPERLKLCMPEIREQGSRESFRVVMAARMHPMKDYVSFLQVARLLTTGEYGAWQFQAIGDGPSRAALLESAADLIARKALDFPQAGIEVLPYVCQADVGVLLTAPAVHQEGCSNAIMEYMACGLPVVCSDSGGNRELVVDGVTGFIVPKQHVNAVAEKLLWLRAHPLQARVMGMAARQRLLAEFTVERLVERTVSVYTELLSPTGR